MASSSSFGAAGATLRPNTAQDRGGARVMPVPLQVRVLFYDLGLSPAQAEDVRTWEHVDYRRFDFSVRFHLLVMFS